MDGIEGPGLPPMTGVRMDWKRLPDALVAALEAALGSGRVTGGTNLTGGFGPAIAARLNLADGRCVFVKAIDGATNPDTPGIMRREAWIGAALPPSLPAPRLLWTYDADGWVVLVFEHVEGRQPGSPWRTEELTAVVAAVEQLGRDLTPCPIPVPTLAQKLGADFSGWRRLAAAGATGLDPWSQRNLQRLAAIEATWEAATAGDTLLHSDLRADNMVVDAAGKVWIVDWPNACRGAAWFDLACMAPSVTLEGGPEPEHLMALSAVALSADPAALTALVVALAGYFTERGAQPDPPGMPTVRSFQRAQGEIARRWVMRRTGWP